MTADISTPTAFDRPTWADTLFAKLDDCTARLARIERSAAANVEREFFTVDQATDRLPFSTWTVRQACNTGRISASKLGDGSWRIPAAEIQRVEREGLGRP